MPGSGKAQFSVGWCRRFCSVPFFGGWERWTELPPCGFLAHFGFQVEIAKLQENRSNVWPVHKRLVSNSILLPWSNIISWLHWPCINLVNIGKRRIPFFILVTFGLLLVSVKFRACCSSSLCFLPHYNQDFFTVGNMLNPWRTRGRDFITPENICDVVPLFYCC